jgi:hypothetical protein
LVEFYLNFIYCPAHRELYFENGFKVLLGLLVRKSFDEVFQVLLLGLGLSIRDDLFDAVHELLGELYMLEVFRLR